MSAPLPVLTGEENLPETEPRRPGRLGWFYYVPSVPNPRTWWDIVKWWECRRPAYNGLVILIAAPSYLLFVAILFGSNAVQLNRHGVNSGELIVDPIEAFIAMNVFYAAGWAIELTLRALGIRDRRLRPDLAKIGLVFSRIVVLLPLVLAIFDWLVRLHTPGTRSIFDYGAS